MGHGRPEPLTTDEAKAAILVWGRDADRAIGRRLSAHPALTLGGAVGAGIVLATVLPRRKGPRRSAWSKVRR